MTTLCQRRMHVVYGKTAIDNCWSSRASSPSSADINRATMSPTIHKMACMARPSSAVTRLSQTVLQNCNIFLFTDLTFLESSRRADVMLQLTCNTEIFTVKWQKLSERPKMVHPSPFLDPTFGDP